MWLILSDEVRKKVLKIVQILCVIIGTKLAKPPSTVAILKRILLPINDIIVCLLFPDKVPAL